MNSTLVCFAVKQEAHYFQQVAGGRENVRILITGMGRRKSAIALRAELKRLHPSLMITAGFAGGLKSDLSAGTVLFAADPDTRLESRLLAAGARPARFLCVNRVAATAHEKMALRESSGADAVEMESESLREICRSEKIPSATVRVVLDTVDEDLPLDFNSLMDDEDQLSWAKLMWALLKSPAKVKELIRLQKQSAIAANKLGEVLIRMVD